MKSVAIALSALAALVAAQDVSGVPECGVSFLVRNYCVVLADWLLLSTSASTT